MAELDMNNAYIEVPYDEAPDYIAHTSGEEAENKVVLQDSDGEEFTIEVTADTLKVNDKEYYSKTKVDELLSAAKTELEGKITQAKSDVESSLQSWASGQFQPKV